MTRSSRFQRGTSATCLIGYERGPGCTTWKWKPGQPFFFSFSQWKSPGCPAVLGRSFSMNKDWRAIEQQAQTDYQQIADDQDAVRYIVKYFAKDQQADYLKIYHSDRHEMNRSPKQAIANLLRLPPLQ